MPGPQDWGAVAVEDQQPSGPAAWGAQPIEQLVETPVPAETPHPFINRIIRGDALMRAIAPFTAAAKGAAEGFGSEPLGLSDEHIQQLRDIGIFRDPITGRGGAVGFMNEAVGRQVGVLGDLMLRGGSAAVGAVAGAVEQFVQDAEGQLGNPTEAKNEVTNFLNYSMLRGDHEFGRVDENGVVGPQHQPVGVMPRDQDFKVAAHVLSRMENAKKIHEHIKTTADLANAPQPTAEQNIVLGKIADVAEQNLRQLWADRGVHPAEAVKDAQNDAFLRQDLKTEHDADGEPLRAAGAEVTRDMPSLEQQPVPPAGQIAASLKASADKFIDIGRDMQMLVAPMATGSNDARAIAKDFANAMRRNRWEWSRIDDDIANRFTPEQRKRMWDAADEESVLRQEGQTSEHMGLATLEPDEREAVEQLQARGQQAWLRARDAGMVQGEGLPAYTPRMVINIARASEKGSPLSLNAMGQNLRTRTGQMLHRKYLTAEETEAAAKARLGEGAEIARDIRTLPLATAKLEDAIAGRTLINNIREYGRRTGEETVTEGAVPAESPHKWFTMQEHPAFMNYRPKFNIEDGNATPALDADGNMIFEKVPMYVRDDFEGPLRSVLTQKSGPLYRFLMDLKGKTMGLIMNSPLIHNAVEWGRAMPAMPGKVATFKVYFEGNRVKNDPAQMKEAIDSGLVPIGHRFFNQDITSIMEEPNLTPGRSWTAKLLGFIPGLFDADAGNAVKTAIDKAGNFWHNTLLWDRIGDLQAGLYANFRDELLAKGVDRPTATKAAAHWANRFAGALPQEAMSQAATKVANFLMFSRSFTIGNLGIMKDAFTGLPKDVLAQIKRDSGTINPEAASYAKAMGRRRAAAVIGTDIMLMYVGNSILQSAINVLSGDHTLDQEMHGYAQRFKQALEKRGEHPLSLLQPLDFLQSVSSTSENEPGKQDRIRIGYAADGTAIYMRNPVGKIGEEFTGYLSGPLDMMRKKMGTVARPLWQILSNDAGFGRKIYDPNADTVPKFFGNIARIVEHIVGSQLPENQLSAVGSLVKGEGDAKVNYAQAFGPLGGVTFSKGAPGGPAVGELYHAREIHDYAVQAAMPDIRKQIQRGDIFGARQAMTALGIPDGLQRFYIRTTVNPASRLSTKTLRDFYKYATPEQRQRLEAARP